MARSGHPTVRISRRVLDRYLLDGEVPVVATRQHWVTLAEPFGTALLSLLLVGALSETMQDRWGEVHPFLWWVWLAVLARAIYKLVEWSNDWFVATDRRMLMAYGLLNQRVAMMPLKKVTDMNYVRSLPGRLLGYGKFVLESAGQDQAMREITFVPDPDEKYRRICATIFSGGRGGDDDDAGPRISDPGVAFDERVERDPFETGMPDDAPSVVDRFDPDVVHLVDRERRVDREHLWEPVDRDDLPPDWEWIEDEPVRPQLRVVRRDEGGDGDRGEDPTGPLPPRR